MFGWRDFKRKEKEGKEIERKRTCFPCLDVGKNRKGTNQQCTIVNEAHLNSTKNSLHRTENRWRMRWSSFSNLAPFHFRRSLSLSLSLSDPLLHSFPTCVPPSLRLLLLCEELPPLPSFSIATAPSCLFATAAFLAL